MRHLRVQHSGLAYNHVLKQLKSCRVLSSSSNYEPQEDCPRQLDFRPHRIILLRHGESQGNVDQNAYVTTADWRIPITDVGKRQAQGERAVHCMSYLIPSFWKLWRFFKRLPDSFGIKLENKMRKLSFTSLLIYELNRSVHMYIFFMPPLLLWCVLITSWLWNLADFGWNSAVFWWRWNFRDNGRTAYKVQIDACLAVCWGYDTYFLIAFLVNPTFYLPANSR